MPGWQNGEEQKHHVRPFRNCLTGLVQKLSSQAWLFLGLLCKCPLHNSVSRSTAPQDLLAQTSVEHVQQR